MGDKSAIEWTDATWNPVTGCSKVSPGCDHCYAETISLRFGRSLKPWTPENARENVVLHPDRLEQPLKWREPRMVFVNSMSDLFHELIPVGFIECVFDVMRRCPQHTFQILTKRPARARSVLWGRDATPDEVDDGCELGFVPGLFYDAEPLPNVWIGVSIETAQYAIRADILQSVPAAVRFVSAEPLLGSLFTRERAHWYLRLGGIDWLIVGGESGAGHRPMKAEWARELRDACAAARSLQPRSDQRAEWLRDLPNRIASSAANGHPIVVPDPGTEHGRRLIHALGAQCTVEMTLDEYLELINR